MSGTLTIGTAERMIDVAGTYQQLDDHDHVAGFPPAEATDHGVHVSVKPGL